MACYNIANLTSYRASYTCQICYKPKFNKMYEYQAHNYGIKYTPEHFKKVCGDCIYKAVYGGNLWKKKKKEGTLDEM